MYESFHFRTIEIEGFRGFRDRIRFDIDASAVIIQGPNGSGKTSFCDAMQWLLLGEIDRLDKLATRRDTTYVENLYRTNTLTSVRAELTHYQYGDVSLERKIVGAKSPLEWTDSRGVFTNEEATDLLRTCFGVPTNANFQSFLLRTTLLQQDMIRSVLEDKPADQYRNLVTMLGLDELEAFANAVAARAELAANAGNAAREDVRKAELALDSATARLDSIESRIESKPEYVSARESLARRLSGLKTFSPDPIVSRVSRSDLSFSTALQYGELVRQSSNIRASLEARLQALPTDLDVLIETNSIEREQAENSLREADTLLTQASVTEKEISEQSENVVALASLAIPLLEGRCPVCDQFINADDVRHRLERGSEDALSSLAISREAVINARNTRTELDQTLSKLISDDRRLHELSAERRRLDEQLEQWQEEYSNISIQLEELFGSSLTLSSDHLTQLDEVSRELRDIGSAISEFHASVPAISQEVDVVKARTDLTRLSESLEQARARAQYSSSIQEHAASLQRTTVRACAAVTERRSNAIAPIVQDIYGRLDPHPTLKTLDFQFGVYYERGSARAMVIDQASGVKANPLLVLSSSQTNVAALACFLSLGWTLGSSSAGLTILDDPLQSMDDVNALGFSDVCRHLRSSRQLIVSTHDRRLSSLLRRKLAPRVVSERTVVLDFQSWSSAGPVVEVFEIDNEAAIGNKRVLVPEVAA